MKRFDFFNISWKGLGIFTLGYSNRTPLRPEKLRGGIEWNLYLIMAVVEVVEIVIVIKTTWTSVYPTKCWTKPHLMQRQFFFKTDSGQQLFTQVHQVSWTEILDLFFPKQQNRVELVAYTTWVRVKLVAIFSSSISFPFQIMHVQMYTRLCMRETSDNSKLK